MTCTKTAIRLYMSSPEGETIVLNQSVSDLAAEPGERPLPEVEH
jgi:hypothetical protein